MGGIVDSIGDFVDPVTDFLGFGETDAQQAAKDARQFQEQLATQSYIPLGEALGFAGLDPNLLNNQRNIPFVSGPLSLQGTTFQGQAPFSRRIRQSLGGFTGLANQNLDRLRQIEGGLAADEARLRGNQSDFIQARVSPLQDTLAQRRAQLQESQARRGIRGSSFGEADVTNLDVTGERALADQRALATQESLNAILANTSTRLQTLAQNENVAKDIFNAQQAVETGEFARALEGLGLSIQTRNTLLALASNLFRGAASAAANFGQVGAGLAGTVAGLEQSQQSTGLGVLGGLLGSGIGSGTTSSPQSGATTYLPDGFGIPGRPDLG